MTLKDCYAIAAHLSKDPAVANDIVDEYHFMSGIDKQFLSIVDAVIGMRIIKGLSYNQMMSLIL